MRKRAFNYSLWRELENEKISELIFIGRILDLGGSKKSPYLNFLKGYFNVTVSNIKINSDSNVIFDMENIFPFINNSYDHVLCVNVLEHIYEFKNVFLESNRILKENGRFILFTPFIYQIHSSPDDYFRYTKSALIKIGKECSFKKMEVNALGFGLFSLLFQMVGGGMPTNYLKNIAKKLAVFLDKLFMRVSRKYVNFCNRVPLGYFIIGHK